MLPPLRTGANGAKFRRACVASGERSGQSVLTGQHLHESMKVCVGIVTHNRHEILPKAIESALGQTWKNKEVVVFDNGSTDATTGLQSKYPGVRWERSNQNIGYVNARNHLMTSSSAELFCSLDDDAWFTDGDDLSRVVRMFVEQPVLAAVALDILSPDKPLPSLRSSPVRAHMFIGCGHVVRLTAVREAGLYVENPGSYGSEEKDLSLRLLDKGFEILKTPGLHVWHEKSPISRDPLLQHRSGVCNDLAFALRRFPRPMIYWILPGKIISHLYFSVRHKLLLPCLEGLALFGRNFRTIAAARIPVRASTIREFYLRASNVA